jgi:hypothetical protein
MGVRHCYQLGTGCLELASALGLSSNVSGGNQDQWRLWCEWEKDNILSVVFICLKFLPMLFC